MDLKGAAERAVKVFLAVKKGEKVLILTDKDKMTIAEAFFSAARTATPHVKMIIADLKEFSGMEPPKWIADEMKCHDVIFAPMSVSISHTKARRDANKAGARIATLPRITEETLRRGLSADIKKMKILSAKLEKLLSAGKTVRITSDTISDTGTDLTFSIRGRKPIGGNGIIHNKGGFCNLPEGEVFIAPVEGTANGRYVVDGSILGEIVKSPITVTLKDGLCTGISGGSLAKELNMIVDKAGEPGRNLAEFGIGINDRAKLCGNVLEDEKILGTIHLALGNNATIGGKVSASIHIDGILLKPTFYIDGKKVMDKGRLLV